MVVGVMAKKYRATFGGDENVLKLTVIMFTQFYGTIKSPRIIHFKGANCGPGRVSRLVRATSHYDKLDSRSGHI